PFQLSLDADAGAWRPPRNQPKRLPIRARGRANDDPLTSRRTGQPAAPVRRNETPHAELFTASCRCRSPMSHHLERGDFVFARLLGSDERYAGAPPDARAVVGPVGGTARRVCDEQSEKLAARPRVTRGPPIAMPQVERLLALRMRVDLDCEAALIVG